MRPINKHGLNIVGMRKAASATKWLSGGYYSPNYCQINYNRSTGEVWVNNHSDFGHGSRTIYANPDVVSAFTDSPCTMQNIADIVAGAVKSRAEIA